MDKIYIVLICTFTGMVDDLVAKKQSTLVTKILSGSSIKNDCVMDLDYSSRIVVQLL